MVILIIIGAVGVLVACSALSSPRWRAAAIFVLASGIVIGGTLRIRTLSKPRANPEVDYMCRRVAEQIRYAERSIEVLKGMMAKYKVNPLTFCPFGGDDARVEYNGVLTLVVEAAATCIPHPLTCGYSMVRSSDPRFPGQANLLADAFEHGTDCARFR